MSADTRLYEHAEALDSPLPRATIELIAVSRHVMAELDAAVAASRAARGEQPGEVDWTVPR